jgi:hypothetical protein
MILLVTRWRIQEGTIKFCYPKVEVPVLRVTVASVSNVSAARNAEFELLKTIVQQVLMRFKLVIDNTTNPNNAF